MAQQDDICDRRADVFVKATAEPIWLRRILIGIIYIFFILFLYCPLIVVFQGAFAEGWRLFFRVFTQQSILHSVEMTAIIAMISLPLNAIFGIAAAWLITHFRFFGRKLLISLIDIPVWISPVIAGLMYVLIYGRRGYLGGWLNSHHIKIIFALPGMIMATSFVSFPFVAKTLLPIMQSQGSQEEEAALTLGASGWQSFFLVTLPKIRWGFFYGLILCNARAIGEFGAVSIVSAKISGLTNTMPLEIEYLYNDYLITPAFAVASLLAVMALITLIFKSFFNLKIPHSSE